MEDADSSRSQPVVTLASPEESSSFEDANGDDKLVLAANALIRSETTVSAEVHQEPRTFVEPDGLPPYFRSQVNLHSKPEHKIPSFESSVSKVATSSRDGVRGLRDVGGVVRSSESMKRLSPDANLSQQWLRPASATDVRRTIEEDDDERERWRPEDDVDADLRHSGSTEDSLLGKMMEVRCRENSLLLARGSVVHLSDDDEEPKSKVRYNDTGSLEEVNEEVIDMFTDDLAVTPETATREPEELEDTEVVVIEGDVVVIEEPEIEDVLQFSVQDELIALQYRKLWALRATFEEEENVEDGDAEAEAEDDTGADDQEHDKVDYQKEEKNGVDDTQQEQEDMSEVLSVEPQSEPPAALEAEAELSEVIIVQEDCYCSSTVADQGSIGCVADESEDSDCPARDALLNRAQRGPMSSQEARRQSYKNILTKRVKKMEHKSDQQQGGGGSCSVDNSFDSVETEGSSTDASRREVVTTSLESTTDNTDSTGEGQINRLQQMKADSGYKSLETNGGNTFRPIKKQIHFALEDDGCGIETMETDDPGRPLQENIHLTLDDKTVSTVTLNLPSPSSSGARRKDRFSVSSVQRSSNGKTASKKRREYTRERHVVESSFGSVVVAEFDTDISPKSDSLSVQDDLDDGQGKASVFLRFFRSGRELPVSTLSRDFSIDEKSDTLFREFSRRDPTYELGTRCRSPRLHSRHRLYHRHSERAADGSTTSGATGSPRRGRSKLSPQESIEEEEQHGRSEMEGDLLGRTMVHIPTIKVAGENSS